MNDWQYEQYPYPADTWAMVGADYEYNFWPGEGPWLMTPVIGSIPYRPTILAVAGAVIVGVITRNPLYALAGAVAGAAGYFVYEIVQNPINWAPAKPSAPPPAP